MQPKEDDLLEGMPHHESSAEAQVLDYATKQKSRGLSIAGMTAGQWAVRVGRFLLGFLTLPVVITAVCCLGLDHDRVPVWLAEVAVLAALVTAFCVWLRTGWRSYLWGVAIFVFSPAGMAFGWCLLAVTGLIRAI